MPSKGSHFQKRKRCDCGATAQYQMIVRLLAADLETENQAILFLCEVCLEDEKKACELADRPLSQVLAL